MQHYTSIGQEVKDLRKGERNMLEIETYSIEESVEETGGDLGCMLGCGTACVLTYMAGAAVAVALADF